MLLTTVLDLQREAQPAAVGVVMGEASGNSKSGPATKAKGIAWGRRKRGSPCSLVHSVMEQSFEAVEVELIDSLVRKLINLLTSSAVGFLEIIPSFRVPQTLCYRYYPHHKEN